MKAALSSVIDRIDTQNRRIQNRHPIALNPVTPDYRMVDFHGAVLADYTYPADEPNVDRYCICVVPQGTFIDADRQRLRKGEFRLPTVDAMFPAMSQEKLDKTRLTSDTPATTVTEASDDPHKPFTSKAEIDAARAEAIALRKKQAAEPEVEEDLELAREQARLRSQRRASFEERLGVLMGQAWHNGKRLA